MKDILCLLKFEYDIVSDNITSVDGGFSAKAYCVKDVNGLEYFVKVYDKSLPTTRFSVNRIDNYMPVLNLLAKYPTLHERILTPIPTKNGIYKAETDNDVYVLFLFVHGELPKVHGMTYSQTVELAEILAHLHDASEIIACETHGLDEDISLKFCERLTLLLDNLNKENEIIFKLISTHEKILRSAIYKLLHLRDAIRLGYSPLVLCHGDAHGNNVIQSKHLVLVDWEDLRYAPAEADLFIYAWHKHSNTFLEAYTAARKNHRINYELLHFYTLRRRIEDVWVDIQRLTEESPNKADTLKLIEYIQQGIKDVQMAFCSE